MTTGKPKNTKKPPKKDRTLDRKSTERLTEDKTEEVPKERTAKEPSIKLEFLAEFMASFLGNMHLFSGVRSTGDILIRVNEIVADPEQYDAGVKRAESQMKIAIELASWLGAVAPKLFDISAEKRIRFMYTLLRIFFYEAPWPRNPRIYQSQKDLPFNQNSELIEMTLNLLRDVPCVRELIEAQRSAGNLGRWKVEQRDKSKNAYSKLRQRLLPKVEELKTYLSDKLLDAPDSTVKTSEKNSGAKITNILAPDAPSGATNAGKQAPVNRERKKRKKSGV